jgi:hypothetical protein
VVFGLEVKKDNSKTGQNGKKRSNNGTEKKKKKKKNPGGGEIFGKQPD